MDKALLFALADEIQRASLPRTPRIKRIRGTAVPNAMVDVRVQFTPAEPFDNIAFRELTWWIDGEKPPIVVEGDDSAQSHKRILDRHENEFTIRFPAGTTGKIQLTDYTHLRRTTSSPVERFVAGVEGFPAAPQIRIEILPVLE